MPCNQFGLNPPRKRKGKRRTRAKDDMGLGDVMKTGTNVMMGTAMIGVTARVARDAFS